MKKIIAKAAKGFTLIELMIVVAIIGILAAIAIPKFADLVNKSKESAVKGSLGSIRSAISIYYSDTEGIFPASAAVTDLASALTTGNKYLDSIPSMSLPRPTPHTGSTNTVVTGAGNDTQGWLYRGSNTGILLVNCNHTDTKSSSWSLW
jgi:prepilin-type N-terminal cleavage/methylation domain-containing protein